MTTPVICEPMEVLTVGLQGEVFALDAHSVREILDVVPMTEVPGARPFVGSIINVRGRVVPLTDLRVMFGMEQTPPTLDTRIVVVETELAGEPTIVGILADKVYEVTEIAPTEIEDTPRIGMRWRPEYIRCIGKRSDDFVIVPDLGRIFS